MSSTGLAVIVGHGVPRETIDGMYESALEFFELEHARKMESCLNVGYGAGGFVPMGVEVNANTHDTAACASRGHVALACVPVEPFAALATSHRSPACAAAGRGEEPCRGRRQPG